MSWYQQGVAIQIWIRGTSQVNSKDVAHQVENQNHIHIR
jgi:hypothetical protein